VRLFRSCHDGLRGTRGCAMTPVLVNAAGDRLSWESASATSRRWSGVPTRGRCRGSSTAAAGRAGRAARCRSPSRHRSRCAPGT
jgi:hypothetical protein